MILVLPYNPQRELRMVSLSFMTERVYLRIFVLFFFWRILFLLFHSSLLVSFIRFHNSHDLFVSFFFWRILFILFLSFVLVSFSPRWFFCLVFLLTYSFCYGNISKHTPKMDSSNLKLFSELACSGKTTSLFLRDIWQTDCKPRTARTSFVWLPFFC